MIPHLCPFELEIKMADEDEIFRKFRGKTPERMADFEKPCFSLELEIFKSTTKDGEPAPAVETPSTSEISNQDGNRIAKREGNSDSQELEDFISAQKSSNTVKKTKSDMRALKRFCSTIDETREPETMTAKKLDKLLSRFFKDITKENGEEYEPSSLTSFQRSFQRYFSEKKLPFNISEDDEFSRSRQVLAAKRKSLVQSGFGNKPNATRELTEGEREKLFETRQFGEHDPLVLQRTLWWFLSLHFGFRARDESRKLYGEMYWWKRILKQAENFSFGRRKKDQKQGKPAVKLATDELSHHSSLLKVMPDAR